MKQRSIAATVVKNAFGRVLEGVIRGERVVITKHDAPKAVLMSIDEYHSLSQAGETRLDTLSHQFDALLDRMQTPKARRGLKAAFGASPARFGRAAVAAARRRG